MPIGGSRVKDGAEQIESFDDPLRAQVELAVPYVSTRKLTGSATPMA
jgi:hypothetical protein